MAEIQWGLAGGNGTQNAFAQGFQIGEAIKRRQVEQQTSNALSGLVANPQQDDAQFSELIKGLPGNAALQLTQARQQYQQQARQQERDAIPVTLNMLRAATPENWQGLRQRAIQLGIPGAQKSPEQYDQNWIGSTVQQLQAFSTPQGREAASTAGKEAVDAGYQPGTAEFNNFVRQRLTAGDRRTIPLQPGGSVAEYDPATGQARLVIAPNNGSAQTGSPVSGELPRITDPAQARRLPPGSQFLLPDGRIGTVPGGGSSNAAGGFR